MNSRTLMTACLAMTLAACGGANEEVAAERPSNLDINSAKRSCSTTASLAMLGSGVPEDAINRMCDCSIDRMIETGDFSSIKAPDDASMEAAMEHCLNVLEAEMLSSPIDGPAGPSSERR